MFTTSFSSAPPPAKITFAEDLSIKAKLDIEKNAIWIGWDPSHDVIPDYQVDVKLENGDVCYDCSPKKLRWAWDFGLTPTCIVGFRPTKAKAITELTTKL